MNIFLFWIKNQLRNFMIYTKLTLNFLITIMLVIYRWQRIINKTIDLILHIWDLYLYLLEKHFSLVTGWCDKMLVPGIMVIHQEILDIKILLTYSGSVQVLLLKPKHQRNVSCVIFVMLSRGFTYQSKSNDPIPGWWCATMASLMAISVMRTL